MHNLSDERRAIAMAWEMAEHLSKCRAREEVDFDSKRLNVLLGWLNGHGDCDNCRQISKAYATSRKIYTASDLPHAHAAARHVADILAHVA